MRHFIDPNRFLRGLVHMPVQELPDDWSIDKKTINPQTPEMKAKAKKGRKNRKYEVEVD